MAEALTGRVLAVARGTFVWSGLIMLGLIGTVASLNVVLRLVNALANFADRWVILGLVGVVAGATAAAVVLFFAWRFSASGDRALRLTVVGGFALLAVGQLVISVARNAHMTGESRNFDAAARLILAGQWDMFGRAPGYPILLSGAYAILGPGPTAGELLNVVLGLVAGGALFSLLRRHAGTQAAVLGLYLFAMWPAGALISNVRLSEWLYIALILLAALGALGGTGARSASIGGALLGAAQYVRPTTLVLLPAFMLARLWPQTGWRPALVRTALPMVATALVVLIPIVVYNVQAYGEPTLSTTVFGGSNLYVGTNERSGGRWSAQLQAQLDALTPGGLREDSNAAGQLAIVRLTQDPLLPVRLAPAKFDTLWGSENFGVSYAMSVRTLNNSLGTFPALASGLFYAVVVVVTTVVAFRRRHDLDRLTALCIGLVLSVSAIHFLYEVRDRYHAYVTPLFIAVTAIGLASWLEERVRASRPAATAEAPA